MQLIANISMLFSEIPLCERFSAARRAGFDAVEIQFPYFESLNDLRAASLENQMPVVLINLPAGDWQGGDAGLAALAERRGEFLEGMERCLDWAKTLQVEKVNVLAGRAGPFQKGASFDVLVQNLTLAGERFGETGISVMLEAINACDVPEFYVSSLDAAFEVLGAVDHENVQLQFDIYHMARSEPSLVKAIGKAGSSIGHVQFADHPGRHAPGSGNIDFGAALDALKQAGYRGMFSAEYRPDGPTENSLHWMQDFRSHWT